MSDHPFFPVVAFYFAVSVDGEEVSFQEVSGLEVQLETEDARGGVNADEAPLPTKRKLSNLTLKRGVIKKSSHFHNWVKDAFHPVDGESKVLPKDILIELLDSADPSSALLSWNIIGAYPIKWSWNGLNSQKNEILAETVELTIKDLKIETAF